jgi:hypothetical protein
MMEGEEAAAKAIVTSFLNPRTRTVITFHWA